MISGLDWKGALWEAVCDLQQRWLMQPRIKVISLLRGGVLGEDLEVDGRLMWKSWDVKTRSGLKRLRRGTNVRVLCTCQWCFEFFNSSECLITVDFPRIFVCLQSYLCLYILLTVRIDITSGRWPTWRTILLYNTFISILYMFRANACSSSGGQLY